VVVCVPKTLSELMERWNRISWRNDRATLFRSGRPGLAIQVEVAKNLVQLPYGFRVTANDCLIASGEILKLRSVHDMKSAGCAITNSFPSGLARTTQ